MAEVAMAMQQQLVRAFVDLADTLVSDFDVVAHLGVLCERCVEAVELDAAGAALADDRGRLALVAASNERMKALELFEIQTGQGPCADAFGTGELVVAEDLDRAAGRWPRFVPMALREGFHSAAAFPLRSRTQRIGALNVYRPHAGGLDEQELRWLQALADVASIAILHERALRAARVVARQLEQALDRRVVIEQAKGVVGTTLGIDMPAAFESMRRFARQGNRRLHDVAQQLVDGTLSPRRLRGP
jgi:GAF domain-containing protein